MFLFCGAAAAQDAVCVVALYASLIRWLSRLDRAGAVPPEPLTELIAEDRWIAQRYGVVAFFGDRAAGGGRVDIDDYAAELWRRWRNRAGEGIAVSGPGRQPVIVVGALATHNMSKDHWQTPRPSLY